MSLNPITALLESLEKLITEHGSAPSLEKHIALLKEQLTILDKKFLVLESKNKILESEIETLKSQNQAFTIQNEELKQKIQDYGKPHYIILDQANVAILKLLSKETRLTTERIARDLNMDLQVAKSHLEELFQTRMIQISGSIGQPKTWYLAQEGRRYLIQHKLTP